MRKPESRVVVLATCGSGDQFSVALVLRGEQRVEKAFASRGGLESVAEAVRSSSVFAEINYCYAPLREDTCRALGLPIADLSPGTAERARRLAERYCEEIADMSSIALV